MRVILFRGKRIDNGMWIEGCLRQYLNGHAGICCNKIQHLFRVDTDTVGQYTGLKDKNGRRIFEGDVIHTHYANVPPEKCDQFEQVVFHNGRFCGMYSKNGCKMWAGLPSDFQHFPQDKSVYMDWCIVIGNIHDNPDLLKGE